MNYKLEDTILYLDKVDLGYDGKLILKDVSLIEKNVVREGFKATGQTIAFIGRSGRGKSTLFKALTGLLKPLKGDVLITDMKTDNIEDAKVVSEGDVGFVDQKYTLFRHKTITQICEYALRNHKEKVSLIKRIILFFKNLINKNNEHTELINTQLKEWGLFEHKDKYPCELSGGQRQRCALVEQLFTSKHFIVLDEPFSGLDVGNIEKVKKSFELIQNSHELNTIIFSTHDIKLAVELADSIYVIGHPEGTTEYSTVLKNYDLKEMGLAWKEYGDGHRQVYNDIKELLLKS